ncbi:EndoS/ChiA family endoglycosidase [Helcococcus ovis]|uniref:EndoS/ChiA family endoglycosidase n=1 Tax=Helcococcus ovis TaxID=72026 RepID=UPI00107055B2|nr:hypothetical protein [Helcococcus ovis]TFF67436.1 hypothetical protein EQF93_05360 [Helcococcus ovis]WNZ01558.1 hypothetical protein EQF90_001540 [Helcococcus ovis]
MKKFTRRIVSLLLVLTFILGIIPFNISKAATDENKSEPLLFGYYRVWHDIKNGKTLEGRGPENGDPKGIQRMSDLPEELDVVFLFIDHIDSNLQYRTNPFYKELPNYVKKLHNNGTKVVRTIDISLVTNKALVPKDDYNEKVENKRHFSNDKEGYKQLANLIVEEYVKRDNLDGLDIDMEKQWLPSEELSMAIGVINEVSKLLKAEGKLFIFDTDKKGDTKIFQDTADKYDYVLYQSYRQEDLDYVFDTFKSKIPASKFVPGFSFYEEGGNKWFNLSDGYYGAYYRNYDAPLEKTFAYKCAMWQPRNKADGLKGGVFAFAVERSGIKDGDNTYKLANYDVLKKIDGYLHQSYK